MRSINGMNKFLSTIKKAFGAAVVAASLIVGASFIAACASPAGDDGKDLLSKTGFEAVTDITGIPEEVQPGTEVELSALAQVEPSTATVKTIVWSVAADSELQEADDVTFSEDRKKVTPTSEGALKLTATITAGGAGAADFTKNFTITVSADAAELFIPVTDITGIPEEVQPDVEVDLDALAQIDPLAATVKTIVWSVAEDSELQEADDVTFSEDGKKVTSTSEGSLTLTATIAEGGAEHADFTKDFTITVSAGAAELFIPVTDITGIPVEAEPNEEIDLDALAQVEPSAATVKTIVWSVAADSELQEADGVTFEDGKKVTSTSEGALKLTATIAGGVAEGEDFTKDFTITVSAGTPVVTEPVGPSEPTELTADLEFGNVAQDDTVEINLDADHIGEAAQTITMAVSGTDVRAVKAAHFIVYKTAAQNLAVGGADAGSIIVTIAGSVTGTTSPASATDAIVSVSLDNFDAQFEGKAYTFTLTVSESDKLPKTYTINLDAQPELTGSAIFVVDRSGEWVDCGECGDSKARWITIQEEGVAASDGRACVKGGKLTRITTANVASYANGGAENVATNADGVYLSGVNLANVNADTHDLSNAIMWIEHNAKANTEYLIRVEKSEDLVSHCLMGNGQDNVIIRLRGHGETERLLQFDHTNVSSTNADTRTGWQINRAIVPEIGKVGYGWITLGYYESSSYSLLTDLKKAIKYENNLTLQIEKNITLDGEGRTLPQGQQQRLRVFISFNKRNATFIMEEGSKITRAKIRSDGQSTIEDHNGINTTFWMKGGTITDNQSYNNDPSVRYGFIKMSLLTQDGTGIFKKTGGSFINNLHNKFYSGNQVVPLVSENHYYITKDTISLYNPES